MGEFCKNCGAYQFNPPHCNCRKFECAIPWRDSVSANGWHEVWAYDAEAAAEKFAQETDSDGDYTIIRNGEGEVWTREGDECTVTKWSIEAESVPTYSARAIAPAASAQEPT